MYIVLAVIVLVSCQDKHVKLNDESRTISSGNVIHAEFLEDSAFELSSIADSVRTLNLEASNKALLSYIVRISRVGENFLIYGGTGPRRRLLMFDNKGKYLFAFGDIGRGPAEYVALTSYFYDDINQEIIIYDQTSKLLMKYGIDGSFKGKLQTSFIFEDFTIANGNQFVVYSNVEANNMVEGKKMPRGIYFFDSTGIYVSELYSIDSQDKYQFFNILSFSKCERNALLISTFDDNIYAFQESRIKPEFRINFGDYSLTEKERFNVGVDDLSAERIVFKGNPCETSGYIYFQVGLSGSKKLKHCLIDKSNLKCQIFDTLKNDFNNTSMTGFIGGSGSEFYSFINDTDTAISESMSSPITQVLILHLK